MVHTCKTNKWHKHTSTVMILMVRSHAPAEASNVSPQGDDIQLIKDGVCGGMCTAVPTPPKEE